MTTTSRPLFVPAYNLRRRDGQPMTEEDEDALLEFGAYQTFFQVIFTVMASLNITIENEDVQEEQPRHAEARTPPPAVSETRTPFSMVDLERVDGRHFTEEDEHALLEFGGVFMFVQFTYFCYRGIEMVVDGMIQGSGNEDMAVVGQRLASQSCSPFAAVKRNDGTAMTQEDEDALMEYAHLFYVHQIIEWLCFMTVVNWDVSLGFGIFPAADNDLVHKSKQLAKAMPKPVERLDDMPMTQDDEDVLAPYGAFVVIGQMASMVYSAMFGGLVNVPIKTKQMDNKIKRTPSGAELSATLGLTVKKSLGLDNKARKVKIRGLI